MYEKGSLGGNQDWITDCCLMTRSNRLVVASMNRAIGFYDLSNSNQYLGHVNDCSKAQSTPLCIEYVDNGMANAASSEENEIIIVGDDLGGISILKCSKFWSQCDGRGAMGGYSVEQHGFSSRIRTKRHA